MLKTVFAIAAAAASAGAVVGFIPAPPPADAAATGITYSRNVGCSQPWPYYERSCLRDGRQHDGNAHGVRVIAVNNRDADSAPRARR